MKRFLVMLLLGLISAGCGQSGPADSSPTGSIPDVLAGQKAYEKVCAGCHAEGLNGAPKTGDLEAWEGRSWLWEAVLFEHARSGYENMPAKGDDAELDELTVTKAAEYMMTLTYPDLPPG